MFRRVAPAVFLAALVLVAAQSATAQVPGELDLDFSAPDGKATTNFTTGFDSASSVLVQGDGKIVAVGMAGGSGGRFALVRYNSDGKLDSTGFGADGRATTNLTTGFDAAFDAALDADENIVAVGRAGGSGGRFAVLRYLPDGSLDPAFGGGDGMVMTNITSGDDRADAVVLRPVSEAIVVAGTANYFGANGKFAVAQYDENGVPDTSFSGDGKLTTDFTTGFDGGFGVAITPAEKVVVGGQAGGNAGLASYDANGALDTGFGGGDGKVTTNFTNGADYFDDLGVSASGKLFAAGASNFFGPNSKFAIARYDSATGALDTGFGGGDGKAQTDFTTGFDGAYGLAITGDFRVVVGGYAGGSGGRFAVARYFNSG